MNRISNGKVVKAGLPVMKSITLAPAATTGATDTIPAPGAGFRLEIFGASLVEGVNVAFNATGFGMMLFITSAQPIVRPALFFTPGTIFHATTTVTGIRVKGNENEALTLTNHSFDAGTSYMRGIIFYRIVPV